MIDEEEKAAGEGSRVKKEGESELEALESHLQRRKAVKGRGAATRRRGSRQEKTKKKVKRRLRCKQKEEQVYSQTCTSV